VQCLVLAAKDDASRKEQLVLVNTRLLALCTAHDSVAADTEKLEAAAEVYRDLLSSVREDAGLLQQGGLTWGMMRLDSTWRGRHRAGEGVL
jgi:hypothetical protein